VAPKAEVQLSYTVDAGILRKFNTQLGQTTASDWAIQLGTAMYRHQITSERRAVKFLATILHESGCLRYVEELASGAAYERRADLGNTHAGDGRRYKGRGLIQITGRRNYAEASKALGHDFVSDPKALSSRQYATASAAWWWQAHGCNELADTPSVAGLEKVTRRVNGGMKGWSDRLAIFNDLVPVRARCVPMRV
jgi:putative chitinase